MLKAVERVEKEQKSPAAGGEVSIADRIAIGARKAGDCSKGMILRTIFEEERAYWSTVNWG